MRARIWRLLTASRRLEETQWATQELSRHESASNHVCNAWRGDVYVCRRQRFRLRVRPRAPRATAASRQRRVRHAKPFCCSQPVFPRARTGASSEPHQSVLLPLRRSPPSSAPRTRARRLGRSQGEEGQKKSSSTAPPEQEWGAKAGISKLCAGGRCVCVCACSRRHRRRRHCHHHRKGEWWERDIGRERTQKGGFFVGH